VAGVVSVDALHQAEPRHLFQLSIASGRKL
jgi:hypothetical protein